MRLLPPLPPEALPQAPSGGNPSASSSGPPPRLPLLPHRRGRRRPKAAWPRRRRGRSPLRVDGWNCGPPPSCPRHRVPAGSYCSGGGVAAGVLAASVRGGGASGGSDQGVEVQVMWWWQVDCGGGQIVLASAHL